MRPGEREIKRKRDSNRDSSCDVHKQSKDSFEHCRPTISFVPPCTEVPTIPPCTDAQTIVQREISSS